MLIEDHDSEIFNHPVLSHRHGAMTIEGWSRAGIQTYFRVPELRVGFDMGGCPWSFLATNHWFISHPHLDHLSALPSFIMRRAMMKMDPPHIYVPKEVAEDVRALLAAWQKLDRGEPKCHLVGMAPGDEIHLSDQTVVTVFPTVHPVPSQGYVVWDKRQKLKPEYLGLSSDQLKAKRHERVPITQEVRVPLVAYTGDTAPGGLESEPAIYRAQVLIVEFSFSNPKKGVEGIHRFGHLHITDFISRAERFENELVIAAHVSTRDTFDQVQAHIDELIPETLRKRLLLWRSK